jgi:hypothetical protein
MARKLGAPLDFDQNEARNLRAHVLAGAPGTPVAGQIYYNSTENKFYGWNNSAWLALDSQGSSSPDASTTVKGILQLAGDLGGVGTTAAAPIISVGAIDASKIAGSIKPSGTAAVATEALRALGTAANTAAAGNDARLSDTRTPTTGSVVDASVAAAANIALSKLAVDPLARANHTGTQLAATVSNFDTQVRTSRLDQMAAPTSAISLNAQRITNQGDPISAQDSATKSYVDATSQGLNVKDPARVASTANVSIASPGATVDGVAMAVGNRVLLLAQTAGAQNGPWVWNGATVAMTRPADFDTSTKAAPSSFLFVAEGTNGDNGFTLTTDAPITLGTTVLTFVQFSGAGQIVAGAGLTKTGNTLDAAVDNTGVEVFSNNLRLKDLGVTAAKLAVSAVDLATTKVTGTLTLAKGGTGQTTAKTARETGLAAAGYYTSATHAAGTTIIITQATHGLRAGRGLVVQTQDEATGDIRLDDISVAASGDVTIVYATSRAANSIRVTIIG